MIKKSVGRPPVMNVTLMMRMADLITHNYTVVDVCRGRISRSTYYRYLKTEPIFKKQMDTAKDNQNKVSWDFRTTP